MTEVDIQPRSAAADLVPRLLALGANLRYRSPRTGAVRTDGTRTVALRSFSRRGVTARRLSSLRSAGDSEP
jgi:hypothetical protein